MKKGDTSMHKHFSDWYRDATIEPSPELLGNRWKGIVEFVKQRKGLTNKGIELARVFFGLPTSDEGFSDDFRKSFQAVDNTFPMRGNDRELSILAGATIAHIIDKKYQEESETIALAIICGNCQGIRASLSIGDIPTIAHNYIAEVQAARRAYSDPPQVQAIGPKINQHTDGIKTSLEQNQPPQVAAPLVESLTALAASISDLAKIANERDRWIVSNLQMQFEETQILWWLLSGTSQILDKPFSEMEVPVAAMVSGSELASKVYVRPGPARIQSFIREALTRSGLEPEESSSIADGIVKAPQSWKEWLLKDSVEEVEDLCPVHFSSRRSLAAGGGKSWIKAAKKDIDLDIQNVLTPISLGSQAFYERLFLASKGIAG